MKKLIVLTMFLALACMAIAPVLAARPVTGNGAPSGQHFTLNIIGVPKEKSADMSGGGSVIFVKLYGADTKIWLTPGDSFMVTDKDGTDGNAGLQLLDPYPTDTNGIYEGEPVAYRIFVRALGKPGGDAALTSGFVDEFGNYWYSLESVTLERTKGQSVFGDETLKLTTIYVDITDDGINNPVRYTLFGNALWDYFWDYDNNGLKLLQIRIYMT